MASTKPESTPPVSSSPNNLPTPAAAAPPDGVQVPNGHIVNGDMNNRSSASSSPNPGSTPPPPAPNGGPPGGPASGTHEPYPPYGGYPPGPGPHAMPPHLAQKQGQPRPESPAGGSTPTLNSLLQGGRHPRPPGPPGSYGPPPGGPGGPPGYHGAPQGGWPDPNYYRHVRFQKPLAISVGEN